jgi:hypothetical protein
MEIHKVILEHEQEAVEIQCGDTIVHVFCRKFDTQLGIAINLLLKDPEKGTLLYHVTTADKGLIGFKDE